MVGSVVHRREELVDEVVATILDRAPRSAPPVALAVLDELRTVAVEHNAEGAPWMMHVVATFSTVARTARSLFPLADKASDEPTADLLTQRLTVHEQTAWMLRSLLEE